MLWAVCLELSNYTDSDWELVGVYSSEAKAKHAKALYLQDARNVYAEDITIHEVELDDWYWRTVRLQQQEEAERRRAQREAEEAARAAQRKAAEEAQRRKVAEKITQLSNTKSIHLSDDCTEQDIELALQLAQDAKVCAGWEMDPHWDDKKAAIARSVKWTVNKLHGKLINIDEFMPFFHSALGL